jgi:3-hydroxyisobutyrate dehydrogenase-like beta-hydroxyacid dehydrogenase
MSTPIEIGFLGTGIMGFPMARLIAEAGHRVRGWNRTRDKAERLLPLGVTVTDTAATAAADTDIVICMLSSGPACDETLLGPTGVIAAMRPGSTLIVMSSIPVGTARQQAKACEARSISYLDAPVSGGETGAQSGTLAIMAGGTEVTFERVRPLLEVMGRPTLVGGVGCGQLAKLVNQLIVASTIATVAEALLFAERGGADPSRVREALLGGFADSTILRKHGARMIARDFIPGGPAKYQVKDTSTALELASELDLDMPILAIVDRLFADMVAHGDGDIDHSGIIREMRRRNGLDVS